MFILIGLPHEDETAQLSEKHIEEEYDVSVCRISLPSFTGVSLEGIVNQVERLASLEKGCESLLRVFIRHARRECGEGAHPLQHMLEDMEGTFQWDAESFATNSIDDVIVLLNREYLRINETFAAKTEEFAAIRREHDNLQRLTRGSLCDINLNIVVDMPEKYEFLKVLYIVVQKDKTPAFDALVQESALVPADAVERINSDEEYVLFKVYVLHHDEDKVRSAMSSAGFVVRMLDGNAEESEEIIEKRRRAEERHSTAKAGLAAFIHIHLIEMFRTLVHVKLLKLFVESVYRYGLPTQYMFFVSRGEKSKILRKWTDIARDWPSDRMVYEDEVDNDESDVFFAFSEVDLHVEE